MNVRVYSIGRERKDHAGVVGRLRLRGPASG
jgi:hypothetical protein